MSVIAKSGLLVMTLGWAACGVEASSEPTVELTTEAQALGLRSSDPTPPRADRVAAPARIEPAAAAAVPGARIVGFYDMSAGFGLDYQVPPILAAGGTAVNVLDPGAAELSNLNVLWVHNPENAGFGGEYLARTPEIAAAVQAGMVLVIHDRAVTNAASILPGGGGISIIRDFAEQSDINIRDASTVVTAGLDNLSLDQGNSSNHGFAVAGTLPARSRLLLSSTSADRIVTFCFPFGRGSVIYSTIPLDFYLQGGGGNPPRDNLAFIYSPNVVNYALAGACSVRGPRPTPQVAP